jgi:uncharacterized protein YaeQ
MRRSTSASPRHPSESMRYMLTRTLAYCLSYEDGITFSRNAKLELAQ